MRPMLNIMALMPSALVISARSSTMSLISVWRTVISKALAMPISAAMSEVGEDLGNAGRRHHGEQGRACRQHQVDDDQHPQARQAVGDDAGDGPQEEIEDVEQEAGQPQQEGRVREAEHQPGQGDLLDPAADHRNRVARDIKAKAPLGQRRRQPQMPVRHPLCLPGPAFRRRRLRPDGASGKTALLGTARTGPGTRVDTPRGNSDSPPPGPKSLPATLAWCGRLCSKSSRRSSAS